MEAAVQSVSQSEHAQQSNDYHQIPPTEKQMKYARSIAIGSRIVLPWNVQQDRKLLSGWIDENKSQLKNNPFAAYPSSKQVGFAERIARIKRTQVPPECFKDKTLMSKWIDANI